MREVTAVQTAFWWGHASVFKFNRPPSWGPASWDAFTREFTRIRASGGVPFGQMRRVRPSSGRTTAPGWMTTSGSVSREVGIEASSLAKKVVNASDRFQSGEETAGDHAVKNDFGRPRRIQSRQPPRLRSGDCAFDGIPKTSW